MTELATLTTLIPLMLVGEYQRVVMLAEQATQSVHNWPKRIRSQVL
ncbi:hypothetical protein [Deinococcus sp. QL22]|nr:hypothetical protein [Deinococcus sp. QL22]UQN07290.1 hypothetical protein M1R55_05135 [Deinococcus sp. QL22]